MPRGAGVIFSAGLGRRSGLVVQARQRAIGMGCDADSNGGSPTGRTRPVGHNERNIRGSTSIVVRTSTVGLEELTLMFGIRPLRTKVVAIVRSVTLAPGGLRDRTTELVADDRTAGRLPSRKPDIEFDIIYIMRTYGDVGSAPVLWQTRAAPALDVTF